MLLLLPFLCSSGAVVLFNFSGSDSVDSFFEVSDTVRTVGLSKASITMLESEAAKRAVLFTLLNPQENTACFAGVKTAFDPPMVWSAFDAIGLAVRAQGMYNNFKVVVQDKKSISNSSLTFEQFFVAPTDDISEVYVDINMLKCFYRGKPCSEMLDVNGILSFGFQAAGGVYEESFTNRGPASLEINYITLAP